MINFKGIYRHPSVVSEFGGLFNTQDHKIAYYTLNICNSYACELLLRLDFDNIILSTELKDSQITDLIDAFRKRNGLIFRPHILSSGRRPVMYIRRDPFKKYSESGHDLLLKDGNNEYRIRYQPECTELVENRPFINTFNNRELTGRFIVIDEKEDLKWL